MFSITVYDGTADQEALNEAVRLYREIYAEQPYAEGEADFASFAKDLPRRAAQQSFRLVIARRDREPLGFAVGHSLQPGTSWWDGALTPLPPEVITEYRGRTFAVIELAVTKPERRRGIGLKLHSHLTVGLQEERRTLLVRPDARAAQAAYARWNYYRVGQVQPSPVAPIYDAMLSYDPDSTE